MNLNQDIVRDLAAIERLHQKDMTASKAGDFETLLSLMSDDAVTMPPGGKMTRGKEALTASFSKMKNVYASIEVLEYILDFQEVQVLGEYAFEWGEIRGSMRARGSDEIEHSTYKVMRILQRQPDGEWKVHRTIWNDNPTQAS